MSTTLLIVYMTLGEIAIVTIALSIYIVIRARRLKQVTVVREEIVEKEVAPTTPESSGPTLESHIQQLIQQTRARLANGNEEDTRVLLARIQFLEAEATLLSGDPGNDTYWTNVKQHLSSLFTSESTPVPPLAELDDINNPPETDGETSQNKKGSIEIDTSQQEISRLRVIIGRQHGAIDDLKQSLEEQGNSSSQSADLSRKLEQIEVAQAQLNMCIDILEKENERLNDLLVSSGAAENVDNDILDARQELHRASERIDALEQENAAQALRIQELENELSTHEATPQVRDNPLNTTDDQSTEPPHSNDKETPHAASDIANTPGDEIDIELFTGNENEDIPVLEPYSEEFAAEDLTESTHESDMVIDDGDMVPVSATATAMEQLDEHDIVVEDDYLDSGIEDEVNSFLSSHGIATDSGTSAQEETDDKKQMPENAPLPGTQAG